MSLLPRPFADHQRGCFYRGRGFGPAQITLRLANDGENAISNMFLSCTEDLVDLGFEVGGSAFSRC